MPVHWAVPDADAVALVLNFKVVDVVMDRTELDGGEEEVPGFLEDVEAVLVVG